MLDSELQREAAAFFADLQVRLCQAFSEVEDKPFREDLWRHAEQGGGRTRVLTEGSVFEKAGINFSDVGGEFQGDFANTMPGSGQAFRATGISLVLHPRNPFVPTVHANFRYLVRGDAGWFGGGADLTPYYPYKEDCIHFHQVWKGVCEKHPTVADHGRFKTWCDEYFYLQHRCEARGVGGIFFDTLTQNPRETFRFVQDAGNAFLDAYLPILKKRGHEPFTPGQRDFQLYRRGRYVEFNLVYDRGTLFGLKTGGRVESILMSLPLNVRWLYDYQAAAGSRESFLPQYLARRDWLDPASSEDLPW